MGWPPVYPNFLLHFMLHFGCFKRFCHRCRSENTGLRRWRKILPLPPNRHPLTSEKILNSYFYLILLAFLVHSGPPAFCYKTQAGWTEKRYLEINQSEMEEPVDRTLTLELVGKNANGSQYRYSTDDAGNRIIISTRW